MTLREMKNAVEGFEKMQSQEHQKYMIGVRLIAFHHRKALGDKKLRRPEQLFPLDIDDKILKQRIKRMKLTQVFRDQ
jgi:hypothetical protein